MAATDNAAHLDYQDRLEVISCLLRDARERHAQALRELEAEREATKRPRPTLRLIQGGADS